MRQATSYEKRKLVYTDHLPSLFAPIRRGSACRGPSRNREPTYFGSTAFECSWFYMSGSVH